MQVITKTQNVIVLRFDKDEEVITLLTDYCSKNNIAAAFFTGLGACGKVTISYYDLENIQYLDKTIAEDLEIISLTGNVALLDGKTTIHCHGCFSDSEHKALAGHVKSLTVSATCEIHLTVLEGKIERAYDESTGLNLMKNTGE